MFMVLLLRYYCIATTANYSRATRMHHSSQQPFCCIMERKDEDAPVNIYDFRHEMVGRKLEPWRKIAEFVFVVSTRLQFLLSRPWEQLHLHCRLLYEDDSSSSIMLDAFHVVFGGLGGIMV
jgi:hypothetical protein